MLSNPLTASVLTDMYDLGLVDFYARVRSIT